MMSSPARCCRVRPMTRPARVTGVALLFLFPALVPVSLGLAAEQGRGVDAPEAPPTLEMLGDLAAPDAVTRLAFAVEKRRAAMRLAAVGFGARAGLARRTWEIAGLLERFAGPLSRVYRFRDLLLDEGGFTVLPPVLVETRRAFRLARGQDQAASAGRVLRIVEAERIVSAPPDWRDYLIRTWRPPEPPAAVLVPRDEAETALWRGWLAEGWAHGVALADDIVVSDLDRLNQTFEGVVRWHRLHLARMVTAPGISASAVGISGDGRLLRIDETRVRLGPPARFNLDAKDWRVLGQGGRP